MKRRNFLKSALVASTAASVSGVASRAHAQSGGARQYLELRHWSIESLENNQLVSNFLQQAALPSLKRAGAGKLGVFYHLPDPKGYPEQSQDIYTVLAFDSLDEWIALGAHFESDESLHDAGAEYLGIDKKTPAYKRIDNSLMISFEGHPRLKTPRSGKDRIFELRRYESHSELMAKLKIEMFNQGELDIFAKVGLDGVFFGEMLVGANMPNLTYMLAYDSMAEREANFKAFSQHPDWNALKKVERYKGTVSKIDFRFLKPAPFSQI